MGASDKTFTTNLLSEIIQTPAEPENDLPFIRCNLNIFCHMSLVETFGHSEIEPTTFCLQRRYLIHLDYVAIQCATFLFSCIWVSNFFISRNFFWKYCYCKIKNAPSKRNSPHCVRHLKNDATLSYFIVQ